MKKLLLLLLFIFSIGNNFAQKNQEKVTQNCFIVSNFNHSQLDCDTVNFTANGSSNSSTDILGYYWNFGDGQYSNNQNPIHNYSNNGNYTVTLTVVGFNGSNGDCCNDISSQIVSINCLDSCGITLNSVKELNQLGDDNVVFYVPSVISPGWNAINISFILTYEDGSTTNHNGYFNSNNGFPQIITNVDCTNKVIKVTVTIIATNSSGTQCSDTITKNFRLGVCGTSLYNDDNHDGNGFGFGKIGPNPVKNNLKIIFDNQSNNKIRAELYNMFGNIEKIKTAKKSDTEILFDVSQSKKGVYILKIFKNKKIVKTKKIIISK